MHEILIEEKILAKNDEIAAENRKALARNNIYTINIVSAPGAGKTSLIERMAAELGSLGVRFAVVEGDLEGDFDSRRIERHGIPAAEAVAREGGRYPSSLRYARTLGVPGADTAWRERRSALRERARARRPVRVLVPEHTVRLVRDGREGLGRLMNDRERQGLDEWRRLW